MGVAFVDIDVSEFSQYFGKLAKISGAIKDEITLLLQVIATKYLEILQDEIIERKIKISSNLVGSFIVEKIDGLTVEVSTNVEYAAWVNDGHPQTPGKFIPGDVVKDASGKVIEFTYRRGAKSGIKLKADKVDGKKFIEGAFARLEEKYPNFAEEQMEKLLLKYFGDFA